MSNPSNSSRTFSAQKVRVRAKTAIVSDVDFEIKTGKILAIVGESGAGKSMLARSLCGLLPSGITAEGKIILPDGRQCELSQNDALEAVRGKGIVWLPQDPFTSLSPMHRCGTQILCDVDIPQEEAKARIQERLEEVGLPARVAFSYPHQLSGGMRQRVAIAAALDTEPSILIADEPTTALDTTTQGEVLALLASLTKKRSMVLILITHNLGVARQFADEVMVMKAGKVIEKGPILDVLRHPKQSYTRELSAAEPSLNDPTAVAFPQVNEILVEARSVSKVFSIAGKQGKSKANKKTLLERLRKQSGTTLAVDDVSIKIGVGEAVSVVGESGSGKTTIARCFAGLESPTSGNIFWHRGSKNKGKRDPRDVQIVFQNPYSALNPSLTIEKTLAEVIRVVPGEFTVETLLEAVGLPLEYAQRHPRALSGGERQRVAIARAIAAQPRLLICDEAVSALDVRVQDQILQLLVDLQRSMGFAMLFITHDLAVAKRMSTRIVVMKNGKLIEEGPTQEVLQAPAQHYTQDLLAAVPGYEARKTHA